MLPLLIALAAPASAEDARLTPDRPGIGDSTGTPGAGNVVVEGAVAATSVSGTAAVGTSGVTGRLGILDAFELRVGVPDVGVTGGLSFGAIGLGGKAAAQVTDAVSVSAVPTVQFALNGGGVTAALSTNAAYAFDPASVWLNVTGSVGGGGSLFVGGGAGTTVGPGGVYVNAGLPVSGGSVTFGGGGWYGVNARLQLDGGLDLMRVAGLTVWMPAVGASAAF